MIKQIYVTPYDTATKQCTAPSSPFVKGELPGAAGVLLTPGQKLISQSKRLVLMSTGEFGLAVSDYVIRAEPAVCS